MMMMMKHWHFGPYPSGHHWQSHWPVLNTAAYMCKGKGTSLQTPGGPGHTTGSFQSHLHAKLVLFRATHTIERKTTQIFGFRVMSGSVET